MDTRLLDEKAFRELLLSSKSLIPEIAEKFEEKTEELKSVQNKFGGFSTETEEIEFMLIKNGKPITYAYDKIDQKAIDKGFTLFCPHSKEEYILAQKYLKSIGEPASSIGPMGVYYERNGNNAYFKYTFINQPLNSAFIGRNGWKVQDGSPIWWISDVTNVIQPDGDYDAYAFLGEFQFDDDRFVKYYNDRGHSKSTYTTYLCVKRTPRTIGETNE